MLLACLDVMHDLSDEYIRVLIIGHHSGLEGNANGRNSSNAYVLVGAREITC